MDGEPQREPTAKEIRFTSVMQRAGENTAREQANLPPKGAQKAEAIYTNVQQLKKFGIDDETINEVYRGAEEQLDLDRTAQAARGQLSFDENSQ